MSTPLEATGAVLLPGRRCLRRGLRLSVLMQLCHPPPRSCRGALERPPGRRWWRRWWVSLRPGPRAAAAGHVPPAARARPRPHRPPAASKAGRARSRHGHSPFDSGEADPELRLENELLHLRVLAPGGPVDVAHADRRALLRREERRT